MPAAKYEVRAKDRFGTTIKAKQANSLSDALRLRERFEGIAGARTSAIYERHYTAEGFVSYQPRVQVS